MADWADLRAAGRRAFLIVGWAGAAVAVAGFAASMPTRVAQWWAASGLQPLETARSVVASTVSNLPLVATYFVWLTFFLAALVATLGTWSPALFGYSSRLRAFLASLGLCLVAIPAGLLAGVAVSMLIGR